MDFINILIDRSVIWRCCISRIETCGSYGKFRPKSVKHVCFFGMLWHV